MKQLTAKFEPDQFKDEYQTRVEELQGSRHGGEGAEKEPRKRLAPVINLMDALRKSMEQQEEAVGKKEPAATTAKTGGRKKKVG